MIHELMIWLHNIHAISIYIRYTLHILNNKCYHFQPLSIYLYQTKMNLYDRHKLLLQYRLHVLKAFIGKANTENNIIIIVLNMAANLLSRRNHRYFKQLLSEKFSWHMCVLNFEHNLCLILPVNILKAWWLHGTT